MTENSPIQTHPADPVQYWVECSRSPTRKASYVKRLVTTNYSQAMSYYNGINIGRGYKKRLRAHSPSLDTTQVLERAFS